MSTFEQNVIRGKAFPQCTACSSLIVDEYKTNRERVLKMAFENPNELEKITGLYELKNKMEENESEFLDEEENDF